MCSRICKIKFTPQEDQVIMDYVMQNGAKAWSKIAELLPGRTGRQVRERWVNYLSPDVNHGPWTENEDALIRRLVMSFGPRWSIISQFLPTRTDVTIKNRYALLLRHEKKNPIQHTLYPVPALVVRAPIDQNTTPPVGIIVEQPSDVVADSFSLMDLDDSNNSFFTTWTDADWFYQN